MSDTCKALADGTSFKELSDYMYGMFDREIYDVAVGVGPIGSVLAGIVASRMGRGLIVDGKGTFGPSKYVIVGDVLESGDDVAVLISKIEAAGGRVIKLGFVSEKKECGARKNHFRKYPLESRTIF